MAETFMIIMFTVLMLWALLQWFVLKFDGMGFNKSLMSHGRTILWAYRQYAGWMVLWLFTLLIIFIFFR